MKSGRPSVLKIGINMIAFDSDKIDGVGYLFKRTLSELLKIDKKNNYALFVQQGFNYQKVFNVEVDDRISVVKVPALNKWLYKLWFKLFAFAKYLSASKIDLLYSPVPPIPLFIPARIKVITVINDLTPLIVRNKQNILERFYFALIVKLSLLRSDKIIAISNNTKQDLVKILHAQPNKIECVYPCLSECSSKTALGDDGSLISVSTVQPCKNLEGLIRAFKIFIQTNTRTGIKLFIIGRKGWDYEKILSLPKKLGIEDKVIFTGWLDESRKNEYYAKCRAMIYVSFYEGFGLPPLEALCFGKPSIVSNVSSLPEVVGKAGILVDPCDEKAIAAAIGDMMDEHKYLMLTKEIPAQIKKFDKDLQIGRLYNIIMELYAEQQRRT